MPLKTFQYVRVLLKQAKRLVNKEIWHLSSLRAGGVKGNLHSVLRIGSIINAGLSENQVPRQAAALSYYSLISLGPFLAIMIMISGFILKTQENVVPVESISKVIAFVAPPAAEFLKMESADGEISGGGINPKIAEVIDQIVENASSGTVGIVGSLMLVVISIQLISSVENTLNTIWGVRQGRSLMQRIFAYWTLISLGAIVGIAALAFFSASKLSNLTDSVLPFDPWLESIGHEISATFPFLITVIALSCFYRFLPNTSVYWRAALIGGFITAILLSFNNHLSFLYVSRVVQAKSLYGSIGIIPILMFSLYIFWLIILIGGQITYAVQNVNLLANLNAWNNISVYTQETLTLAAFLYIARRFNEGNRPYSNLELSALIRVPSQIMNESLVRLADAGLINPMHAKDKDGQMVTRYQPSCPLANLSLNRFRDIFYHYGNNQGASLIYDSDPILKHYCTVLDTQNDELFHKSIRELITSMPNDSVFQQGKTRSKKKH